MSYTDFVAFRRSIPRAPRLERQTIRVHGISFAVFTTPPVGGADTPPVLCINGGLLYDHSMLWPSLSPLAATRQVILYDQRGRGRSTAPASPGDATIDDDAADVPALRRALGIRQWNLVGHSWGGGIAMLAAALDPTGTRRLALIDPVWPTSEWMVPLRREVIARLDGAERQAVASITDEMLADPDPAVHSAFSRAVYPAWFADPDLARRFIPPEAMSPTGAAILARLRREGYDWNERLRGVNTPTLVIHGERDPLPPAPIAVFGDRSYIASARLVVVPSSGHMPFWEAPPLCFSLLESIL